MNRTEKALLALRADMARDTEPLENIELDYLLASFEDEADQNLLAAAELFGLNLEALEERAAVMEFDGGLARITANRMALTLELQRLAPGVSDAACKWFAQNSATIRLYALERGLTREQLVVELHAYFERHFGEDAAAPIFERAS